MAHPISRPSQIIVPPDDDLGPAMKELTLPQRAFVLAFANFGGTNQGEAARLAGYGSANDVGAASDQAYALLRSPRILVALREEADKRLKAGAILAASVLSEIATDVHHRDRYKAAVELLNRAGLVVEGVSRLIVEDHRTTEEITRRVVSLAVKLGIDPTKLLGNDVIDADYTEVDVEKRVDSLHEQMDDWQDGERALDAILERSAP